MNEVDVVDLNMLIDVLKENTVSVKFTKVDGSERTMNCTLDPNIIAGEWRDANSTAEELDESPVVRVFNTDLQEWRAFRKNSVIEWAIV